MKPRAAVLLSIGLLVVAAALLARGLVVTPGTSQFVGSITASVVAAAALAWSGRVAPATPTAAPTAPPEAPVAAEPVETGGALDDETLDEGLAEEALDEEAIDDTDFPIADYDDLTLPEVLGLLPQLYSDELDVVEGRERRGACRPEVLDTLAHLREHGTDADAEYAARLEEHEAAMRAGDERVDDASS
jgi:hypothetical protein